MVTVRLDHVLRQSLIEPRVRHDERPFRHHDELAERVAARGRPRHRQLRGRADGCPKQLNFAHHEGDERDGRLGGRGRLLHAFFEHTVAIQVHDGCLELRQPIRIVEFRRLKQVTVLAMFQDTTAHLRHVFVADCRTTPAMWSVSRFAARGSGFFSVKAGSLRHVVNTTTLKARPAAIP